MSNKRNMENLVSKLLGAPDDFTEMSEIFGWAERYCDILNTPFNLERDVRPVYDRLPVVRGALKPSNKSPLIPILNETADPVFLAMDELRTGSDALFFFAEADHALLEEWVKRINGRNRTQILIGASNNRMVIAASFTAFLES